MAARSQVVSVKSLALRVLQEIEPRTGGVEDCPRKPEYLGQAEARDAAELHVGHEKVAHCGSPHCSGCYAVEDGKKLHPPKCGEKYRAWLVQWEAKGRVQ
jgi:hypothetical protein